VVTNASGSVTAIVSTPTATTVTARSGTLSTSIQITGASAPVPPAPSPVPVPPVTTSTPIVSLAPTVTTVGVSTGFAVNFAMPDGTRVVSSTWSFGDGTSVASPTFGAAHTYTTVGSFTVSVTAIDALGRAASTSAPVTVNAVPLPPAPPPAAPPAVPALLLSLSCTVAPHGASTSCNIAARDETGANVTAALTHAIWDFGDGSVDETYLQLAHRVYAQAGTYVISVTATGPGGRIGHASTTVIIP
jgi:PKD repeat protein